MKFENSNENEDVRKTVLIEQLNSLKSKTIKMLNETILKDYDNINIQSFITYLMMYKDYFESVKQTIKKSV